MRFKILSLFTLLTVVSQLSLAQQASFAPTSATVDAKERFQQNLVLIQQANVISALGEKACETASVKSPKIRDFLIQNFSEMLARTGSTLDNVQPGDEKIANAVAILMACPNE